MAKLPDGYQIHIISTNGGDELQKVVNNFINSGIAEEVDEDIQFYLNIAYIKYKPKNGVHKMTLFKYNLENISGVVLANNAEEADNILSSHSRRGAIIVPLMDIVTSESPRIL